MMNINRVIVIVLDSVGAGEMTDAAEFGDSGANTLAHVAQYKNGLNLPNMQKMGLGNIIPIQGVPPTKTPTAAHGIMNSRLAIAFGELKLCSRSVTSCARGSPAGSSHTPARNSGSTIHFAKLHFANSRLEIMASSLLAVVICVSRRPVCSGEGYCIRRGL